MKCKHEVHAYTRCEKCGDTISPNVGYVLSTLAGKVHARHKACTPGELWSPPGVSGWERF